MSVCYCACICVCVLLCVCMSSIELSGSEHRERYGEKYFFLIIDSQSAIFAVHHQFIKVIL